MKAVKVILLVLGCALIIPVFLATLLFGGVMLSAHLPAATPRPTPTPALFPDAKLSDEDKALLLRLANVAGAERKLLLDHKLAYLYWQTQKHPDLAAIDDVHQRATDLAGQVADLQDEIAARPVLPGFAHAAADLAQGLAFQQEAFDQVDHPQLRMPNGQVIDSRPVVSTDGNVYLDVPLGRLDVALEQQDLATREINRLIATR
jgi:hypothetical protein